MSIGLSYGGSFQTVGYPYIGVGTVGAVGAAAPTNNWKGGIALTR